MPRSNLNFGKKLSRLSTSLTTTGTIASGSAFETSVSSVSGGGVTVYNTINDLPLSGNNAGDQAFIDSDSRLYIYSGEGWYNIGLINTSPTITSGYEASYDLAIDGTATVITLIGSDPEGIPITWSYSTTGLDSEATISQGTGDSANIFTVTPSTNSAKGGTFSITFTASDGVNIATAASSFSLVFNDGQIKYVSTLIQSDDNTYITDASNNSLVITENGDVRPSAFSPFKGGYYSNYFDGSGDYLRITDASLSPGTGNFTVEGWLYLTSDSVDSCFFDSRPLSTDNTSGFNILFRTSSKKITVGSFGLTYITSTNTVTANQWHHISVVRNSGTLQLFIDGTSNGSASHSTNLSSTDVSIGTNRSASFNFSGYISNFRIVAGTALYTSAFTPSTSPLTTTSQGATESEVGLLTCQSSRFIDNSTNDNSITITGNTSIKPFNPFAASSDYATYGSAYFDGSGDYLSFPYNANLATSTGDYTIESWFYLNSLANSYYVLGGNWNAGATDEWLIQIQNNGNIRFLTNGGGTFYTGGITTNRWYHFAAVRASGTVTLYLNGSSIGSFSDGNTLYSASKTTYIGSQQTSTWPWNGYISNFRIVVGTALYTSSFTPSTTPLTTTSQGATASEVSLLTLQTNKPINNTKAVDKTGISTVTTGGDAHMGSFTPYTPFGHSVYFDGTGDYLMVPNDSNLQPGTGDFTAECWVYCTGSTGSYQGVMAMNNISSGRSWRMWFVSNTSINVDLNGQNGTLVASGSYFNQWVHLAYVKNGSTNTFYVNGISKATYTTSTVTSSTDPLIIGGENDAAAPRLFFNGYISNVRIASTALYTSNFTPSTSALTPTNETSLLTCQSPSLIDNGPYRYTITRNGDAKVTSYSPFNPHTVEPNGYGVFFDGGTVSNDYLGITGVSAPGTGDFTIEAWINFTRAGTGSGYRDIFILNGRGLLLNNGILSAYGIGPTDSTSTDLGLTGWHHVALARETTTMRLFLDGTIVGTSLSNSTNWPNGDISIGSWTSSGAELFTGHISNVRYIKGSALYTSDFTPSTSPLTTTSQGATASEVVLLTCQDTTIKDNSNNAYDITVYNNPKPTEFNPFGYTTTTGVTYNPTTHGGSAYFDGTGDYLSVPANVGFSYGTGDFTHEAWIYPTTDGSSGLYRFIMGAGGSGQADQLNINNAGNRTLVYYDGTTSFTTTNTFDLNAWNHVAVSRSSGILRVFINGVQGASTGSSANLTIGATNTFYIGNRSGGGESPQQPFVGYISNVRVINGTGLYTSNFVPPKQSIPVANETLSLPFNDAAIYNTTTRTNINTLGNAKVSHAVKKYGNGSMYFDGSGDYLQLKDTATLTFNGSSTFTVEGWFYQTSSVSTSGYMNNIIGDLTPTAATALYWSIGMNSANKAGVRWYDGAVKTADGSTTLSLDTWYHIAWVVNSGSLKIFVNGTEETLTGTTTLTTPSSTVGYLIIGADRGYYVTGYIDDLRITKGVARYTSAFTPPSAALISY